MAFFTLPKIARRGYAARRCVAAATALLTVAGLAAAVQTGTATSAGADPAPATAGFFRPMQQRLFDTRDDGALTPGAWQTLRVSGVRDVPAGVSAVALSLTAFGSSTSGSVAVLPGDVDPATVTPMVSHLNWNTGEQVSNTAMVRPDAGGYVKVRITAATGFLIDTQGFFTGGSTPAPGGFVPTTATRIVDTRDGTGGTTGPMPVGTTADKAKTFTAWGNGGVPSTANAVFANVTVLNSSTTAGYIKAYKTGPTPPETSLNFPGSNNTAFGVTLDLDASGRFNILVGSGPTTIQVLVEIEGYYASAPQGGAFTPTTGRVYDTRAAGSTAIPGTTNGVAATRLVPITGLAGVPNASVGVAAAALNIATVSTASTAAGYLKVWPSSGAEPQTISSLLYDNSATRSNLVTVAVATDTGEIRVANYGTSTIHVIIDVEGWYALPGNLPQPSGTNCTATNTGSRSASQMSTRALTDRVNTGWNPTNGNLLVTGKLLHVAGVGQDVNVGLRYNALNDNRPTLSVGYAETRLNVGGDGKVAYYGTDGGCYVFNPKSGGGWNAPQDLNATLTGDTTTGPLKVRFNPGGITNTYVNDNTVWRLDSSSDVAAGNPNTVQYTYDGALLRSITDTQARVITFAYNDADNATQPSTITDTSLNRSVTLDYGIKGRLVSTTDAAGDTVAYGYDANDKLASITDGRGHQAAFTYAGDKLATWTYGVDDTATSSLYRADYYSATKTNLIDPKNQMWQYTFPAGSNQTTSVMSPSNRRSDSMWNGHGDSTGSANTPGSGSGAQTNSSSAVVDPRNWMTTETTAPGDSGDPDGASSSAFYPTKLATAQDPDPLGNYRPDNTTDSQGHQTDYTWDDNLQKVSSVTTSGGQGASSTSRYKGDKYNTTCTGAKSGELCRTTDGDGNVTTYTYLNGNPATVTPPAPSGVQTMTYDAVGRLTSRTDGRPVSATNPADNTTYFKYDGDDRVVLTTNNIVITANTTCSAGAQKCVAYTYDDAGNMTQRVDVNGTTNFTYDAQNRVTARSTTNTANVVTAATTEAFDRNGNMVTYTDPGGAVTYGYDADNLNVWVAEPGGTCGPGQTFPNATGCTVFTYDNANRRTRTQFANGIELLTTPDTSGRAKDVISKVTAGGAYRTERHYGYKNPTGSTAADGGLVAYMDTGLTKFCYDYDSKNRLTKQRLGAPGATACSMNADVGWTYTNNGNRTSAVPTTGPAQYAAFTANQLCWTAPTGGATASCSTPTPVGGTTYAPYDGAGNQTTTTGPGTSASEYEYDGWNHTSTATIDGAVVSSRYGDTSSDERTKAGAAALTNGMLGISYTVNGSTTVQYIRDAGGNLIAMRTGGASYYYSGRDRLGSILQLTNTATPAVSVADYTYDAWGVTTTAAGTQAAANPWRYAAGWTDTNGLIKFGTRYYNPKVGRWTQADPAHHGNNWYIYSGDNPTTNIDPSGRWSFGVSGCAFYVCLEAQLGTDEDGDFTGGGGIGLGTGEAGTGTDFGASWSPGDLSEGNYASLSCSYGQYEVGVTGSDEGWGPDGGFTTPSAGSCSGTVGYNF